MIAVVLQAVQILVTVLTSSELSRMKRRRIARTLRDLHESLVTVVRSGVRINQTLRDHLSGRGYSKQQLGATLCDQGDALWRIIDLLEGSHLKPLISIHLPEIGTLADKMAALYATRRFHVKPFGPFGKGGLVWLQPVMLFTLTQSTDYHVDLSIYGQAPSAERILFDDVRVVEQCEAALDRLRAATEPLRELLATRFAVEDLV